MDLGTFSLSLAVKDIQLSLAFYAKLGFSEYGGNVSQGWVILKNGDTTLGLFQGMFDKNVLTFNPGWNADASDKNPFDDVRAIQQHLRAKGIALISEVDESTNGPGNIMVVDPDGNPILIDQHR